MPEKQTRDDPKTQRERFEKALRGMVDAGELDPIEAEEKLERMVRLSAPPDKLSE